MIDYTGYKTGELEVLHRCEKNTSYGAARWFCKCSCGETFEVSSKELKSGKTQSCGHLRVTNVRKANIRHGSTLTPEYRAYNSAKNRCQNPNNTAYYNYGGRGIEFRFNSFEDFLAEVGYRPSSKHSLDRSENNGHYEVGNVKWATKQEQARNRRCDNCDALKDRIKDLESKLSSLAAFGQEKE
jgi:hypothetical protein